MERGDKGAWKRSRQRRPVDRRVGPARCGNVEASALMQRFSIVVVSERRVISPRYFSYTRYSRFEKRSERYCVLCFVEIYVEST